MRHPFFSLPRQADPVLQIAGVAVGALMSTGHPFWALGASSLGYFLAYWMRGDL